MSSLTTDDNNNSKKEEENNENNNMTLQNNPVDMRSIHASGLNTPVKMNNNNDDEEKILDVLTNLGCAKYIMHWQEMPWYLVITI